MKKLPISRTPIYFAWINMKQRCYNKETDNYKHYGGRGITVSSSWLSSFSRFHSDMGDRPSNKHSLDRIDNDKGYSVDNCKWSTVTEQRMNRRQFKSETGHRNITMNGRLFQVQMTRQSRKLSFGAHETLEKAIIVRDALLLTFDSTWWETKT